ncbi:MAG: PaaI family thioesterase [Thermodesulfobacteriota bacterium]
MKPSPKTIQRRKQELQKRFATAPLRKTFGMKLEYDPEGNPVFHLPYNPSLSNSVGGVHGGIIGTLVDMAGWWAAAPFYDHWIATAEYQVRLLQPAHETDLYATGKLLRAGSKIAMCEVEVRAPDGTLVAVGSGTFATTSVRMGEAPG